MRGLTPDEKEVLRLSLPGEHVTGTEEQERLCDELVKRGLMKVTLIRLDARYVRHRYETTPLGVIALRSCTVTGSPVARSRP